MTELVVSEIFGPTVQGEGPSSGMRAGFVRLGRCNLRCGFCDSAYTWRWEDHDPTVELSRWPVADIAAAVDEMDVPLVVVTGGEPLLQQHGLVELLGRLAPAHRVEIETAGTLAPAAQLIPLVDRFNVSPKLASSGNPLDVRYRPDVLRAFVATRKALFKFVVSSRDELDEVEAMVVECGLDDVWVMPEGTDAETVLTRGSMLVDEVVARGWNLTTRLHILLWGDERGR